MSKVSCTNVDVVGIPSLIHGKVSLLVILIGLGSHCIEQTQVSSEIFCYKLHHKLCSHNLDVISQKLCT